MGLRGPKPKKYPDWGECECGGRGTHRVGYRRFECERCRQLNAEAARDQLATINRIRHWEDSTRGVPGPVKTVYGRYVYLKLEP